MTDRYATYKYETIITAVDENFSFTEWDEKMSEQGRRGWEMVSFQFVNGDEAVVAVFKARTDN